MDSVLRKLDKAAKTGRGVDLSPEEIEQAVLLLATEDVKRRFSIGSVIEQQGLRALPALLKALEADQPEIRRTAVYILGRLSAQSTEAGQPVPRESVDALRRGLLDEDPKVRCNSAIALGELESSENVNELVDALERETSAWVRPSIILALGSIGGSEVVSYLSSYQPHDSAERAALRKVLDRFVTEKADWRFVERSEEAIPVELWTAGGLEEVAAKDVREKLSLDVEEVTIGRVRTSTNDLYSLFAARTFSELLIPLMRADTAPPHGADEVTAAFSQELRRGDVLQRILSLHEPQDEQQVMRYRLEVRGKEMKHHVRRAIIREVADVIASTNPTFVNSTGNYNVEIRMLLKKDGLEVLLKPFTIPDDRFSYRAADVPASINPAVAAGVMGLAPKLSPDARVLDPFCGSGTMLFERGFAGAYGELVGIDISQSAIQAAEQNAAAAGLDNVTLIHDDMRIVSQMGRFDEVITNMPFGIRTGKHETNVQLYQAFFNILPQALSKGGLVMLYTQEVRLTTDLFRRSKPLKLLNTHRITAGGLRPAVFVGVRR